MDTHTRPSRAASLIGVLLVLLALVPIVLWPLETCYCIDEPQLITHAARSNEQGDLYITGLFGNFGVPYGPVPTQIYQLILSITHDPATVVIIRGLLCGLVTGFSLLWLARSLGLPQWFAAAFLISPYVSEQMRVLWDASFTIPIGCLALASFAAFVRHRGKWPLRFALGASCQILLIHPMSMPLAFPILGCLVWKYRPALRSDIRGVVYTLALLATLHAKYFSFAFGALMWKLSHQGATMSYPHGAGHLESALAPLLGGNIFNGIHALPSPAPENLVLAATLTKCIYGLIWVGIITSAFCARRGWQTWRRKEPVAALDIVATTGVVGFILQALLYGALRIPSGPQYFFGTFALHAFFAWMGVAAFTWAARVAVRRGEGGAAPIFVRVAGTLPGLFYLGVAAYLTLASRVYKHQHADDGPVWPDLKMATEIVRELNRYDQLCAYSDIDYLNITFFKYPQAIRSVRLLQPSDPAQQVHPKGKLFITFRKHADGTPSGKIEVVDLGDLPLPKNAYFFSTVPLSELWFPDPSTW